MRKQGYHPDFDICLEEGHAAESELAEMLGGGTTIEVKRDKKFLKTGNIFIEYECRGKPSGIMTTKAQFIDFALPCRDTHVHLLVPTQLVLRACEGAREVVGGDRELRYPRGVAKGYLIKVIDILRELG